MNFQAYYCYLDQGKLVVSEFKPNDFEEATCAYIASCPNSQIAELTFRAILKIDQWRSESALKGQHIKGVSFLG